MKRPHKTQRRNQPTAPWPPLAYQLPSLGELLRIEGDEVPTVEVQGYLFDMVPSVPYPTSEVLL